MRDAFGGTFMIQIFLVFILIYIGFTAISLNYAKAFKVKNKVIEYLESSEITDLNSMDASVEEAMTQYIDKEILGNMNYNLSGNNICSQVTTEDETGRKIAYCHDSGIVIREVQQKEQDSLIHQNTEGVYYTVTTFVGWKMPFFNGLLNLGPNNQKENISGVWTITGETRLIVNQ